MSRNYPLSFREARLLSVNNLGIRFPGLPKSYSLEASLSRLPRQLLSAKRQY
jgi:hypothetical protein